MFELVLSNLIKELKDNVRLRIGLWLIIVLLLSYLVALLNQYQRQLETGYHKAVARLQHLQAVAQQTQWAERAVQAKALRSQLEASLWQADTQGLAQATFQQWLNTQLKSKKVENGHTQVKPALVVPQQENLWVVAAQIDAKFSSLPLEQLLATIASYPTLIVTEQLEIKRFSKKFSTFKLMVSAYFDASHSTN